MYEISVSVDACVRAGTRADVAWVVAREDDAPPDAIALTRGGGRMGSLMDGALDEQIAGLVAGGVTRRVLDLRVDALGELLAGVAEGTTARCLLAPAADFPEGTWADLFAGRATCLVTRLDGDVVTGIERYDENSVADLGEEIARFFSLGVTGSLVEADRVITVWWPRPRLAILGGGPIGDALAEVSALLGWQVHRFDRAADAADQLLGFGALDAVVVGLHDVAAAGAALAAALSGAAGYIGGLGRAAMHDARLDWLASRSVAGTERIHGPAGLDIGARRPAEVAIAIVAEILAARSGRSGLPLARPSGVA